MPACGGGSRLGRSECAGCSRQSGRSRYASRSECFDRSRYAGRRECAGRRGCAGGSGYGRPRLVGATSNFDGRRRRLLVRDQSRGHVGNDRCRRRLVCSQTEVGAVARQRYRVEPKGEQTDYDRICEEQTDCASIDTQTGLMTCLSASHRAYDQFVCPPRLKPRAIDDSELVDRWEVTSQSVSPIWFTTGRARKLGTRVDGTISGALIAASARPDWLGWTGCYFMPQMAISAATSSGVDSISSPSASETQH
jgi:hypothetical protein